MRRFAAFVVALVALLTWAAPGRACANVTLSDDPTYKRLHEADEELEEGDVKRARELAAPVAKGQMAPRFLPEQARARAERIVAVSYVRDRAATPEQIDGAVTTLERQLKAQEEAQPSLLAASGEALARAGQDEAAYARLMPLAEHDLIGSPYTWAAFARVAGKRGEAAKAADARKRCSEITPNAAVCRGEYPPPPLLRGKTNGYAVPGVLAVLALLWRRRAKRPWAAYGDKVFAAAIVATCALVFVLARSPVMTTSITALVLFVCGLLQRLLFARAVRGGKIEGWVLRDAAAEDGGLPAVASFFHSRQSVLERVPDPSYREPARVAVLRLTPRRRGALALVIAGVLVLGMFGACATFTMRSSKSSRTVGETRVYDD